MIKRVTALSCIVLLINGCTFNTIASKPKQAVLTELPTAYDYQLLNQRYQPISLKQVATEVSTADVVFIGEYHGNHASHLLQMQLLAQLHQRNQQQKRTTILSMEQFERHQQNVLNDYLDGKVGERYLINKAPTWNNYKASYRPLVEYAKNNKLTVVAANAPADMIRCIGRVGESYVTKLSAEKKPLIAVKPFAEVAGYSDKFFGAMGLSGHSTTSGRMLQSYQAQLTRDNTMAESINKQLKQSPNAQVIHFNGSFHSAEHLGTAGGLARMSPKLKIVVITPIHVDQLAEFKEKNKGKNDYHYLINQQPNDFVDPKNRAAAHKAMFAKSAEKAKLCE